MGLEMGDKKKLLLVNPNFKGVVAAPSLGLGFIGTYIREHSDWEVEIIEPILQGFSESDTLDKAGDSDIVGLVCYTESRFECFGFADKVKQINPACKIIVGGPHVATLDEKILQHYRFIDVVVRMEGEETVLDIVNGKPFKKILGITWRNSEEIIRNLNRPLIEDINNLNYDYSLVYSQIERWKDFEIPCELLKLNALPIIVSRGCPFRCAFCASYRQWDQIYRYCSPEELVKRIKYLVEKYNVGYFRFYDALFAGSNERILKLCDLFEQADLGIRFRIDIRVGTSRQILERLKKVGCEVVGFGVESGSDRILKRADKGITREKVEETIKICKELGYWMIGFFMISFPDEEIGDVNKTFELLKFFDQINIQFFKLHPNTAFYDELKQKGEIDDEIWFDPKRGYNTEYGNEIYYCKELFPSAGFYLEEGMALIDYAYYKYKVSNPREVIRSNGLFKAVFIICLSGVMYAVLKPELGRRLYRRFRKTGVYAFLYSAYKRLLNIKEMGDVPDTELRRTYKRHKELIG
ncbi:MAG: radical SAM protein [Candidatus Omnitrophota bacterium]